MNRAIIHPIGIFPVWMAVTTTWECDARCTTCSIWKSKDKTKLNPGDFQTSIAHHFFDCLRSVAFFGGEPTRHDKLPELVQIVKSRLPWAEVSVVTNGLDVGRIIDILEVISSQITQELLVCVSINGAAEHHDETKGIKGAYSNAVEVLRNAKRLFKCRPRISHTILPGHEVELRHMKELATNLETDISLRCAVSGSYFKGIVDNSWDSQAICRLQAELLNIPDGLLASPTFCKAIPKFLANRDHKACMAHRKTLIVDPSLQTSICHNLPPKCELQEIPMQWGKAKWWYEQALQDCFNNSCFIDGPYSLSYANDI